MYGLFWLKFWLKKWCKLTTHRQHVEIADTDIKKRHVFNKNSLIWRSESRYYFKASMSKLNDPLSKQKKERKTWHKTEKPKISRLAAAETAQQLFSWPTNRLAAETTIIYIAEKSGLVQHPRFWGNQESQRSLCRKRREKDISVSRCVSSGQSYGYQWLK